MNRELIESLNILEKEKDIDKEVVIKAIEGSLVDAYKKHYENKGDKADENVKQHNERVERVVVTAHIDRETGDFKITADKEVVEEVTEPAAEVSLEDAREIDRRVEIGDIVKVDVNSKEFGRIATKNAKNVILQTIREQERNVIYEQYRAKENDIVTGIVQRINGKRINIDLGKVDAVLGENDQVKGEVFKPTERIKLYVTKVENTPKGPRISVSRSSRELVRRLFEAEVPEIREGIVEIINIAREAGVRSKITVKSNDSSVDALGACVGVNGLRVNAIVNELRGEKIDIVPYSDDAAKFVENALSPAKVISVDADVEEKTAKVIVPDDKLSLAIGKEGLNARLAAKITGFKIDIKSETQAKQAEEMSDVENIDIDDEVNLSED